MRHYHDLVKQMLTEAPATRDDDMLLYGYFLAKYMLVRPDETFFQVCSSARARKLPSYESISRARRKVQEQCPELRGTRQRARRAEEVEYHDYYSTH